MSLRAFKLETFRPEDSHLTRSSVSEAAADAEKLAAYEKGYEAGWEDAVAAQDADLTRLRNELGRQLADLSFTYHEAHSHVLRTLEPLLRDMVSKVLPAIARQSLAEVILEQLRPLAEKLAGAPMQITTHPDNLATVRDLVAVTAGLPVEVRGEASLGLGQAHFRIGMTERTVDLDGAIAAIGAAVTGFFALEREEVATYG